MLHCHKPIDAIMTVFTKDYDFRNIPKVSQSFGDRSLNCIVFTFRFVSVMPFRVILAYKMAFLSGNPI